MPTKIPLLLLVLILSAVLTPSSPLVPDKANPTASRRSLLGSLSNAIVTASTLLSNPETSWAAKLEGYQPEAAVTAPSAGRFFFPTLTPPFQNRATYRYELGRNAWALEQLLTFANVTATVRTVVVKMKDGGLWVNGPQWPTGEYCQLLDELGPVKHVVLPCNAIEHKAPVASFVKRYSEASVWITPGQYGLFGTSGLDKRSCKMGYRVDGVFSLDSSSSSDSLPPWADEFDIRTLYVSLPENAGPVSEAAFLHKPTNTLITTDAVVFIPDSPPEIFRTYFEDETVDKPSFWPKSVLQSVFLPLRTGAGPTIDESWPGFGSTRGRLIRAPILRAFADSRAPNEVRAWTRSITEMGRFDRVLTAHFASPIAAGPNDFLGAFKYLDGPTSDPPISCRDWELLDGLNSFIEDTKLGAQVKYDFKQGCPP